MNILVAIDNKDIKKKIDERYKNRVYSYDIAFKEDVIEYLKSKNESYVIITKLNLKGNIGYKEYIETLHKINKDNKIIIIADKLKEEDKKFLFSNEVFNIIEGNEIDIENIYSQIESEDKVIYKIIYKDNLNYNNKRKIAVFGTSGAGKSFISYFLSKSIAKYTENKVVLETLDVINPCLDVLSNTTFLNYDFNEYLEDINNDKNAIKKYITKDSNYNNLSYINKKITFEYKDFENISFSNLMNNLAKSFDFVIFDLPTFTIYTNFKEMLFLVDEIIFVINPNYISLKQAKKYLEYMCVNMGINKDKIKIVINKCSKYSLDNKQVMSILKNFDKNMNIKKFNQMEEYINGIIYNIPFSLKEGKKLLDFLNIKYEKSKMVIDKFRKVEKYG